ncbi:MAG: TlpA disulfide reductase family protein [Spirochaetota bacterium]|nr:TlpA disulfide reductase family protein [Spirochaetota bacterium]
MKRIILTVLIITFFLVYSENTEAKAKKSPNFALYNMKGKLVTLSKLKKQGNFILSFWASYCVPCKKEIPQIVELEKKYGKKKNFKLVLVNINKEGKEKAKPVLKQLGVTNECLLDIYQITAKKFIPKLKIPAVFLITKKGNIVFDAIGESEKNIQNLKKAILKLK